MKYSYFRLHWQLEQMVKNSDNLNRDPLLHVVFFKLVNPDILTRKLFCSKSIIIMEIKVK